jgi:phage-related protein
VDIHYYERLNGRCPVLEFIESLPPRDRVRVISKIELLADLGIDLRRPHTDTLRDHIRELRIRTHHRQHRILYFFFRRNTAVLLDGLTKKTGNVPDVAIDRAIAYRQDYLRRPKQL